MAWFVEREKVSTVVCIRRDVLCRSLRCGRARFYSPCHYPHAIPFRLCLVVKKKKERRERTKTRRERKKKINKERKRRERKKVRKKKKEGETNKKLWYW